MSDLNHEYIFENIRISALTYPDILNHSSGIINTERTAILDIQPETLEIDYGVFYKSSAKTTFPPVTVTQSGNSVLLHCPCARPKNRLCEHQAQILFTIMDNPDFRVFFDPVLRQKRIEPIAKEFGLENEANPDAYFQLEYLHKKLVIKPKLKELIPLNGGEAERNLLPNPEDALPPIPIGPSRKKRILVLRKHKYDDRLNLELYEGETTQSGKIKNPVSAIDPIDLIWKTEAIDEAKFYTAVSGFQRQYAEEKPARDIEALKIIVKNPLGFETFYHNKEAGENISAQSIVPVAIELLHAHIELSVDKKEPFFEIQGGIVVHGRLHPFKNLQIKYTFFILNGGKFYLVPNADMLRVIHYFSVHNQILLVHASRFQAFKEDVLANLEKQVSIKYSYIKTATKTQLVERNFDQTVQKIIYLTDRQHYVSITPVIKYGHVEIPVFSRKQIFDTDQNGNEFRVERDVEQEIHFTSLIMRQHPKFEEQVQEQEFFYLHKNKFLDEDWFLAAFEEWRNHKITILGFNELEKNKLNAHKAVVSVNVASGIDWFSTGLTVQFGKQKASLKQLHKSIRNKSKYVQLDDGTQGILPAEWMKKIAGYLQYAEIEGEILKIPKINFSEIRNLFDPEILSEEISGELDSYSAAFAEGSLIPEVAIPADLKAHLRDYQKEGLNWLSYLDDFNFGGCLADDMGLGKTIQVIAFILLQRTKQTHNTNLVVVPTSLLFNWQAEVEKFAPSIKIHTHYGANRVKNTIHFGQYEIVLTTYGMLLSDIRHLKEYRFNYIFLDESQAIKNPGSERYKAARLLQARNRVVLTGTPVENNTFDIFGQLSFACPGLLGNKQHFRDIYSIPIDKFENSKRAAELRQKIRPFILRRTKKQVAKELPEKTEMVIYCEMGDDQRKLYNAREKELRDYISAKDEEEIAKNSMHVLTGLTKLRLICNSPALLKEEEHYGDSSAKIEALMEQIENKSPLHKILVFSQFVSMLNLVRNELEQKNISFEYLTGQTKDRAKRVNAFQDNPNIRVFLISLKAGGTGLNLTEADYVYLVDPWWNPAVENQAIDRCYRIGQNKHVIAVRLICPDTVEEKIMNLQKSKSKLADDLITTETSVFKSLSKAELIGIL